MAHYITHRDGEMESDAAISTFPSLLAELATRRDDTEHGDVAVTHDSEWSISVSLSGAVVLENLEEGEPPHLKGVPEAEILELWERLAAGDLASIEREPWRPGYA